MSRADDDDGPEVDVDVTMADGRTVFDVEGSREVAIVVRSDGEERIYLPPEEFEEPVGGDSPYQAARDSPYQSSERTSPYDGLGGDSPYQSARGAPRREGTHATADGFRVVHPGEVSEFNVFR